MISHLTRESPFGYSCRACGICCRNKRITLSSYEIVRLACGRKTSTREILDTCTDEGGTALRLDPETGTCVFLADGRCSVHDHRPLACRLYPLGRHSNGGEEQFFEVPAECLCTAQRGRWTPQRHGSHEQGVRCRVAMAEHGRPAANVAGFVPLPRHIAPDIPRSRASPAPFSHGIWPAPEVSG